MLEIKTTIDGSPTLYSTQFDATYHSIHGALTETNWVFIEQGLKPIADNKKEINIFEMGFGTGLNCMATLVAIQKLNISVQYSAVEKFPLEVDIIEQICSSLPQTFTQQQFLDIHKADWGKDIAIEPRFTLHKIQGDLATLSFGKSFDLIYYDAFAPSTQPELWTTEIFTKLFDALHPGGILTTYCAKGQIKRNLKAAGFIVEPLPGPPGKREMTRALKPHTSN